jgi:hypothetical protein
VLDNKSLRKLARMTREERLQRQALLQQLFVAFRCDDDELREQLVADTADTPVEYLEKSIDYFRTDFPEPHMPRGGQINLRARVIAGLDTNRLASPQKAWKTRQRELEQTAVGPGQAREQIGATVGDMEERTPEHRQAVTNRAREIREEGKLVPKGTFLNRATSTIRALIELGGYWGEISEEHGELLDKAMREHEENGGDAAWWWQERENPTVTKEQR